VRPQSLRLGVASAPYTPLSALSVPADFPARTAYRVGGLATRDLAPRVPPSLSNGPRWHGNLDPSSIAYGSRPRLRPASPAADQHGCGTLGHPVGGIRTPLALLMPTFALPAAPPALPGQLHRRRGRSPTMTSSVIRGFGHGLSPGGLSVPRHSRPVSYYALFQGWLLLSQPPGCLRAATALPT
jgi:hypothetical protein